MRRVNPIDGTPRLGTTRLELRAMEAGDVDAVFRIQSNPEAMRYWATPPLRTRAEAAAVVERALAYAAEASGLTWAACARDDGRVVGTVSLFRFDPRNDRAEVGYILDRSAWGHGFMSEALGAAIGHAFGALDLRRIEADTDPRNAASIRMLERLAFRREGLLRERWVVGGEVCDSLILGLLRTDWRARDPARR